MRVRLDRQSEEGAERDERQYSPHTHQRQIDKQVKNWLGAIFLFVCFFLIADPGYIPIETKIKVRASA